MGKLENNTKFKPCRKNALNFTDFWLKSNKNAVILVEDKNSDFPVGLNYNT